MRILRRMEYDHRGSGGAWDRGSGGAARRRGPAVSARGLVGRIETRAAGRHRNRRTRPGGRRRLCARVGDADRRRAGNRQVHPPDSGLRRGRARRRARDLRIGRGVDRAGAASRRASRARRSARATRRADPRRRHRGDLGLRRRAEICRHRFDSDDVERRHRIGAGNGEPGSRVRADAYPLRQIERSRAAACRPCHQGRPDRRTPRRRTHGRRRLFLRRRRSARLSSPQSGQEPLRRHRRGWRLRNDRSGARRGAEPVGAFSRGAGRTSKPRSGGLRRRRRRASAAGRDSGARCADHASARPVARSSAGSRAGSPWCLRCWNRTAD